MKDEEKIIIEIEEEVYKEKRDSGDTRRVLAFGLGEENYCVDIKQVKEVVRPSDITRVPNTPIFVKGVMNLRGDIIAALDIRHFFGLEQAQKTAEVRVVVTDVTGSLTGFIADKVKGTVDVEEDKIEPPLATLSPKVAVFTKGQVQLENEIYIYLDLEAVFRCEEIEKLRKGD